MSTYSNSTRGCTKIGIKTKNSVMNSRLPYTCTLHGYLFVSVYLHLVLLVSNYCIDCIHLPLYHSCHSGLKFDVNKRLHGIRLGHFSYANEPLRLGDLKGNKFTVVMRYVSFSSSPTLQKIPHASIFFSYNSSTCNNICII